MNGQFLLQFKVLGKITCEQSTAQGELARVRSDCACSNFEESRFATTIAANHPDALPFENGDGA